MAALGPDHAITSLTTWVQMFGQAVRNVSKPVGRVVGRRSYHFPGHPGDGMGGAQVACPKLC